MKPLLNLLADWREFIADHGAYDDDLFLQHERTGSPLGDEGFVQRVSQLVGRDLRLKKPGRKKKDK